MGNSEVDHEAEMIGALVRWLRATCRTSERIYHPPINWFGALNALLRLSSTLSILKVGNVLNNFGKAKLLVLELAETRLSVNSPHCPTEARNLKPVALVQLRLDDRFCTLSLCEWTPKTLHIED